MQRQSSFGGRFGFQEPKPRRADRNDKARRRLLGQVRLVRNARFGNEPHGQLSHLHASMAPATWHSRLPSSEVPQAPHATQSELLIRTEYPLAVDQVFEALQVESVQVSSSVAVDVVDGWFARMSQEADATGDSMPSENDVEEAKRIVQALWEHLPNDTDIYLMEERKVAIEVHGKPGRAFLLVCEPGGSALCIVTVNGVSRRARYESSLNLPDCFILEGLGEVQAIFQSGYGLQAFYR